MRLTENGNSTEVSHFLFVISLISYLNIMQILLVSEEKQPETTLKDLTSSCSINILLKYDGYRT